MWGKGVIVKKLNLIFQKMIKVADSDGSGVVEFQEFMEMICDQIEVSLFMEKWKDILNEYCTKCYI
jgi:hypothetical protein